MGGEQRVYRGVSLEADLRVPGKRTTRLRSAKTPWRVSILRRHHIYSRIQPDCSGSGSVDRHPFPARARCPLASSASSCVRIPDLSNLLFAETTVK